MKLFPLVAILDASSMLWLTLIALWKLFLNWHLVWPLACRILDSTAASLSSVFADLSGFLPQESSPVPLIWEVTECHGIPGCHLGMSEQSEVFHFLN